LGPWLGFTQKLIDGDQIPVRWLTGGKGKVGEKVQELMAVTRRPKSRKEGAEAAG
jgi:hypothetical protein